ncbi:MAG: glycosyltransferase [Candidatus Zixiibacteriota bacterium]
MKIAMLAQAGSVHTDRWCEALAARGHHLRLISNSRIDSGDNALDTVYLPGKSSLSYVLNISSAKKEISNFNPDIVHIHYATGFALWGIFQNVAPLVVSVWGTDVADALRKKLMVGPITKRALRKARVVTASSMFLLKETIRLESSVADKIEYIPFSINLNPQLRKSGSEWKKNGIKFIFAKQYISNYAPEMVLQAYAQARSKMPPSNLLMIGGGSQKEFLEILAENLNISNSVSIKDWVEKNTALELIAGSDIMLMPSYQESFGVAALEAAAYGLPVIATNVGGIPEIINDGINGILIEPGDSNALANAMVKLGNNADMRKSMGEAGMKHFQKNFGWPKSIDKMERVYMRVTGGRCESGS